MRYKTKIVKRQPEDKDVEEGVLYLLPDDCAVFRVDLYLRAGPPFHFLYRKILRLNLKEGRKPRWRVSTNKKGQPTIEPSVLSKDHPDFHFYLRDGKVLWIDQ